MSSVLKYRNDLDAGEEYDKDRPVIVDPGQYDVMYVGHAKYLQFNRAPKLSITFQIVSPGPFFEIYLKRHYNIKGIGKKKELIPSGWSSDLVREYSVLFGIPRKLRHIYLSNFENKVFECDVRRVEKDYRGRPLAQNIRYSVINQLIRLKAGGS